MNNSKYQTLKTQQKNWLNFFLKKASETPRIFSILWAEIFFILYLLEVGSDWGTLKRSEPTSLAQFVILNGPGEATVHGREVRGEGVTKSAQAAH